MKRILLLLLGSALLSFALPLRAQTTFVAFLQTSEEELTHAATSEGYATLTLNSDHTALTYQVVVWGISDVEAGHIHAGARGVNGPVLVDFDMLQKRSANGVWTNHDRIPLTPSLVDSLYRGLLYVNVHTLLNSGGEVRGQIFLPETYVAFASGNGETPHVQFAGSGASFFVLNPNDSSVYIRGQAQNMTSAITAAHVHQGALGVAGPIVKPTPILTTAIDSVSGRADLMWTPTDTTYQFNGTDLQNLRSGQLYWNIHTQLHPEGEARGQIGKSWTTPQDTGSWFVAIMSGNQEGEQPVASNGEGTAFILLSPDHRTLKLQSYYSDLTGPVLSGHIHHGVAGEIPPNNIVKEIPSTGQLLWTADDANAPLTEADIDSLYAGTYYVNLHTAQFPEGEIRGQIIPLSQRTAPTGAVASLAEPGLQLEQNFPNPFNPTTAIRYTLPASGVMKLEVTNALGERVTTLARGVESAGEHTAVFDGEGLPTGVYYVTLTFGDATRRISALLTK